MARFDAELYLRLVGESTLLSGESHHFWGGTPVDEAADALAAVGVIPEARATAITADYQLAQTLRQGHYHPGISRARGRRGGRAAKPLAVKRAAPVDAEIQDGTGRTHVRYALFGADEITLSVVHRSDPGPRRGPRGVTFGMHHGPPWSQRSSTLTDDQGGSVSLDFSGSGSDAEWRGQLTGRGPLAADTGWLELDGHRLGLGAAPTPATVRVEDVEEPDPARRHLWHRLGRVSGHGPPVDISPAVDALVAAGALPADDPLHAELEAVRQRLPSHHARAQQRGGRAGALPEPWRSLLRRQSKEDGPAGLLIVGAASAPFDGHRVAILAVESEPAGFTVEFRMTGGPVHVRLGDLAWWAQDDRGNHYLGSLGGWSGGPDHAQGELNYWPALDPRATRLAVMPTGPTQRAVIEIPLEWRPA